MSCLQPKLRLSKTSWAFGSDLSMQQFPFANLTEAGHPGSSRLVGKVSTIRIPEVYLPVFSSLFESAH